MAGMSVLEMIAVAAALVMVVFQIRQSAWLYPFGLISSAIYTWLFYQWGLTATAMLQLLFIALLVYGWVYWLRGTAGGDAPAIRRLTVGGWMVAVLSAAGLTVAWASLLIRIGQASPLVWFDALLAASSVLGQWLLARKYVDNWVVWIGVNLGYTALLLYQQTYLTSGLYAVFFVLAVWGYIAWLRMPPVAPRGFEVLPAGREGAGTA
jgi:nicotinamide mononucleotide transporter